MFVGSVLQDPTQVTTFEAKKIKSACTVELSTAWDAMVIENVMEELMQIIKNKRREPTFMLNNSILFILCHKEGVA